MKRQTLSSMLFFFVLTFFFSFQELWAQPNYEGKTIRMVIGSDPGGGHDRTARLLAKYLPRYIPGKPSIIIENMPGAGTMIAANYLYNQAKPDGLTIGNFLHGLILAQLLGAEGVRFDMRKYSWVGSAAVEGVVFTIRTDHPCKTVDDLLKAKEPIHVASSGPTAADHQFCLLLKEFAGINFRMVVYTSSAQGNLAIERKEVDGRAGSFSSAQPFIERGLVRPLIRSRAIEPGMENLVMDEDLTTDKLGKTLMALRAAAPQTFAKPYVAPPNTPADVMKTLREAFAKVAKDPEFEGENKKLKLGIEYIPADECLRAVNEVLNQPKNIVNEFGKYVKF
jgi:tripartite-type tricarboxylate transporter receptor subunit TctC